MEDKMKSSFSENINGNINTHETSFQLKCLSRKNKIENFDHSCITNANELSENNLATTDMDFCGLSTRSDSAIDVCAASSEKFSTVIDNQGVCRCSCHRDDRLFQRYPERQRPLQVSVSLPIYNNGAYTDPLKLFDRGSWLGGHLPEAKNKNELQLNENSNSNNNNKERITATCETINSSSSSITDQTSNSSSKSFTSACKEQKNTLICIFLAIVLTFASIAVLVYYAFFSNNSSQSSFAIKPEHHATAPPINSSIGTLLNQTLYCGSIPNKYLPAGVNFDSKPVYVLLSELQQSMKEEKVGIEPKIVGGDPANIAQYPWQGLNFTVCLHRKRNLKNSLRSSLGKTSKLLRLPRVIGGATVSINDVAWQASLYVRKEGSSQSRLVCGAYVILKNWLVTAYHCIAEENDVEKWTAYFGMSVLSKRHTLPAQERKIVRYILHPHYSTNALFAYDYDITLLQIDRDLVFNQFIQPICLPPQDFVFPDGMPCFISGWGVTNADGSSPQSNVLQHAQVDIIDIQTCNSSHWLRGLLTSRMLCAGKAEGKKDSCQGDSGGPLSCYLPERGVWVVAGTVSWGIKCGLPKLPGVYTNLSFFTDWIWTQIGQAEGLIQPRT